MKMIKLHELKKRSSDKKRKRVGRGISAGGGMTAGRGTKGQKSRSGVGLPRKFEGGQTPLIMRLHKMPGFKSHRPKVVEISLDTISRNFKDEEVVSMKTLAEKGLIKKDDRVKILCTGELKVAVKIDGVPATKSVLALIEKMSKQESSTKKKTVKKLTNRK